MRLHEEIRGRVGLSPAALIVQAVADEIDNHCDGGTLLGFSHTYSVGGERVVASFALPNSFKLKPQTKHDISVAARVAAVKFRGGDPPKIANLRKTDYPYWPKGRSHDLEIDWSWFWDRYGREPFGEHVWPLRHR